MIEEACIFEKYAVYGDGTTSELSAETAFEFCYGRRDGYFDDLDVLQYGWTGEFGHMMKRI